MIRDYRVRSVRAIGDLEAVADLQARIWGSVEVAAPASLLKAMTEAGGVALLAELGGDPIGFAYGFTGRSPSGILYHRSHAAGVVPERRDLGVGRALKLAQRREAIRRGLDRMVWTFDPSQTRNAHFNLHRLGATARAFHRDYYGRRQDQLNAFGPTDRLVVEWFLTQPLAPKPGHWRGRWERVVEVPPGLPETRGSAAGVRPQLVLRGRLERAFAAGLAAVDYDSQTHGYRFVVPPPSWPEPVE